MESFQYRFSVDQFLRHYYGTMIKDNILEDRPVVVTEHARLQTIKLKNEEFFLKKPWFLPALVRIIRKLHVKHI